MQTMTVNQQNLELDMLAGRDFSELSSAEQARLLWRDSVYEDSGTNENELWALYQGKQKTMLQREIEVENALFKALWDYKRIMLVTRKNDTSVAQRDFESAMRKALYE